MNEIEFVNRELAESEAARAVDLLNQSDAAKAEAWFAMQAVADQVGPASNVGVRGLSWTESAGNGKTRTPRYSIQIACRDGYLVDYIKAPATLELGREPATLAAAAEVMQRRIAEMGGQADTRRPSGTTAALVAAVEVTEEGRVWLAQRSPEGGGNALRRMVRVADEYGREGVNAAATLTAHVRFLPFDDRAELVREFPSSESARAKAMTLKRGLETPVARPRTDIPRGVVWKLALRSGVTPQEARTILRARLDGRSTAKLIRAIKLADEMVAEIEPTRTEATAPVLVAA